MNKYKKIATAVVATVMAGTMVFSIAGCSGGGTESNPDFEVATDENGNLTWSSSTKVNLNVGYNSATSGVAFSGTDDMPVNGGSSATRVTLADGKQYSKGAMKPNMEAFETALGMDLVDRYTGKSTSDNLSTSKTNGFSRYDLITANVSDIVNEAANGTLLDLGKYLDYMPNFKNFIQSNSLIQLSIIGDTNEGSIYYTPYFDGVDDIERYTIFRRDYVSELLDHADLATADTVYGGTVTYKAQAASKSTASFTTATSINAYMGQTDSYVVETADPSDSAKVGYAKVNYAAALTAAKDGNSALGKAITDAAGATYTGTSGNIVDIQNYIINTKAGDVKGSALLAVLREYIKVAYQWSATKDGTYTQLYGATVNGVQTKLSDVFNSTYAAWDVDLYVAIGRCFVTCGNLLGKYQSAKGDSAYDHTSSLYLYVPRAEPTNRTSSTWSLIGELYGVRGLEARIGYSYIDSSGNMRDARFNSSTWEALDNFSKLTEEGLVSTYDSVDTIGTLDVSASCSTASFYDGTNTHQQGLSTYDYVQTQSTVSYVLDDDVDLNSEMTNNYIKGKDSAGISYIDTTDGYSWTACLNPVSKWNDNDTSTAASSGALTYTKDSLSDNTTIMRFTESWRSVKSAGICVPKDAAKTGNSEHLAAILGFIDYLYSNDGRIVNTYGAMAENNNCSENSDGSYTSTCGGFWYGTALTNLTINGTSTDISSKSMADLAALGVVETYDGKQYTITDDYASQAFVYQNKLYSGTTYNGTQVPTITTASLMAFQGKVVNGYTVKNGLAGSYTAYAQQVLGTCLGFAEKMQSFEYQMTSSGGLKGEAVVGTAIGNGTLKHVEMAVTSDNYWYTVAPTGLPLTTNQSTTISSYGTFTTMYATGSSKYSHLFLEVAAKGLAAAKTTTMDANIDVDISTAAKAVAANNDWAPTYQASYNTAWQALLTYYNNSMKK